MAHKPTDRDRREGSSKTKKGKVLDMAEFKRKNIGIPEELHQEIKKVLDLVPIVSGGYSTDIQGFTEKALRDAIESVRKEAESKTKALPARSAAVR